MIKELLQEEKLIKEKVEDFYLKIRGKYFGSRNYHFKVIDSIPYKRTATVIGIRKDLQQYSPILGFNTYCLISNNEFKFLGSEAEITESEFTKIKEEMDDWVENLLTHST